MTIGAGQKATVNAVELGLPRYGLESLEVGVKSGSGVDLSDAISVAPGGAVESQTVTPTETSTGDVMETMETGIAGDLVLTNEGTDSINHHRPHRELGRHTPRPSTPRYRRPNPPDHADPQELLAQHAKKTRADGPGPPD